MTKVLELQLQHRSFQWIFRVWFPLGLTDLISLQSKGLSRIFSSTSIQKHWFFRCSVFFMVQLSSYMTTEKTTLLTFQTFVSKVMSLLFNMLSMFVIAFLPRSKYLLISWLHSPSAVILELKKIKSVCFHFFPSCLPGSDVTRCHDLSFFASWVLRQLFHSPL